VATVAYSTAGTVHPMGGESEWIGVIAFVIALVVSPAIRVADQWERVAILRLGKFRKQE